MEAYSFWVGNEPASLPDLDKIRRQSGSFFAFQPSNQVLLFRTRFKITSNVRGLRYQSNQKLLAHPAKGGAREPHLQF